MRTTAVPAFLVCPTLRLVSQDPGKPQAQAQCKFSDGSTIEVAHLSETKTYELATHEDLLTVMGMSVQAGRYVVFPAKDPRNDSWTLKMRNESAGVEPRELPPVPMSAISRINLKRPEPSDLPVVSFTVSLDQTGGSCKMHWHSDKPNVVLSLESTEGNTDLRSIGLSC